MGKISNDTKFERVVIPRRSSMNKEYIVRTDYTTNSADVFSACCKPIKNDLGFSVRAGAFSKGPWDCWASGPWRFQGHSPWQTAKQGDVHSPALVVPGALPLTNKEMYTAQLKCFFLPNHNIFAKPKYGRVGPLMYHLQPTGPLTLVCELRATQANSLTEYI